MKVFVFDLLAYDANLDHLKEGGPELPYPLAKRHFDAATAVELFTRMSIDDSRVVTALSGDGPRQERYVDLLVSDPNTVFAIREITAIFRRACPMWTYKEVAGGGHMAPLTHPDLINPLVRSFLRLQLADDRASPAHASG